MPATVFKLMTQPTEVCMTILKYLRANIKKINDMGVKVKIEKVTTEDDKLANALRNQGIPRLPALMLPNGKPLIGLTQVMNLFEKNLRGAKSRGPAHELAPVDTDLDAWMRNEMFQGQDKRGNMKPRDDDEDTEGDGADIQRRLANYQRKMPAHRRMDSGRGRRNDPDDSDESPSPPRETRRGRDERSRRQREPESDDDNVASPSPPRRRRGGNKISAGNGDVDQQMLDAWLDNNTMTE